ncbi:acetyl-CoA C-acetyltransferase [Kribbella jiaozuonensis]|uniref:Probable acetyl-CoA acetyltransferase n=1 Tax=Kribbella jiaozuonensis TaxID=2575441 RepID=A0A4U3M3F4_9ACTN|nr:acetyl-CoA C-acetyltransferase [Kribbella jiaozuonensis]TKK82354.1 acetyl-CoA C-acyltransferase [Kribbella jiaozuonensis]
MSDVVICEPIRTPVGRFGGALSTLSAADLATAALAELVRRTGLGEGDVDDVILGQCYPNGEAPAIGRIAALDAGLGVSVPGVQIDRRCGSGLQAVLYAAGMVATGAARVVVAGGTESMSQVEHYALGLRTGVRGNVELNDRLIRARETAGGKYHPVPGGMVETAENVRRTYGITRSEQDEFALQSHQRAVAAQTAGRFADELVPVEVPSSRRGTPSTPRGASAPRPGAAQAATTLVSVDEHPRADTSLDGLAALRPVMSKSDPEATVTAGNASGQNDGAAVCVVTTRDEAERRGLRPLVALRSWAVAGVGPEVMGIGPVPATAAALARADLTLDDLDLIELNEAFAAQVLACLREWKLDPTDDRLNPNGSGISLGHPLGATGARILATLSRELHRRNGRYALETICIGGGQGIAAIFEVVR